MNIEDLISIGTIGLIKAVRTFCPNKKIKLATYASRCIENEILMYFRGAKKNSSVMSIDEPIETDKSGNPLTLMDIICSQDDIEDDIDRLLRKEKLYRILEKTEDSEADTKKVEKV